MVDVAAFLKSYGQGHFKYIYAYRADDLTPQISISRYIFEDNEQYTCYLSVSFFNEFVGWIIEYKQNRTRKKISLEELFELISPEVKEEIIFNLDIFDPKEK